LPNYALSPDQAAGALMPAKAFAAFVMSLGDLVEDIAVSMFLASKFYPRDIPFRYV
jgi:hypothetical protein